MATIERRQRGKGTAAIWRVRWRDGSGRERSKSFRREKEARHFRARLEGDVAVGTWVDPARSRITVGEWVPVWEESLLDLRRSSRARLDSAVRNQVLPEWRDVALSGIRNADVRAWIVRLHDQGYSASTVRKAAFALRRILSAAVADQRLTINPADDVPLPTSQPKEQRYLTADEVAVLADEIEPRYRAMVLVAAYGGLRFGELAALRRRRVDILRGRLVVAETLVDVNGQLSFGPTKTKKGSRTVPIPRSVIGEVDEHLSTYVDPAADDLLFTAGWAQPLRRAGFRRNWWLPAVASAGLEGLRFHDLRHTYVSLLVRAGANVKEVSTWAGHSSVAFTLDRYGHLYDDADDTVSDRLDALLLAGRPSEPSVQSLR